MKQFIFYTHEGYTKSPTEQKVENLQILGFDNGTNANEALKFLIDNNQWIVENGFNKKEIVYKQLLDEKTKGLIKKVIDYNWDDEQKHYEEDSTSNHIFLILKELKKIIE